MKRKKIKINLDLLTSYLGKPEKQSGDEYFWQCPYCKDSGRDNLKYNQRKGVVWCFANESHAPLLLKEICNNRNYKNFIKVANEDTYEKERYKTVLSEIKQCSFQNYMTECNNFLLKSYPFQKILLNKRGITPNTVRIVKLGFDMNKKRWVIPTFQYSTENNNIILGFEYRPSNFSKGGLTREKGTPTGLAMINSYNPKTEILVIIEGYFDGYSLFQYLNEKGQGKYYHITTPSNGVNSLMKYISQVDFSKYRKYYLFLDNDEAGHSATKKIIEKYPMFQHYKMSCGCKDFNEHYLKCIKHIPCE